MVTLFGSTSANPQATARRCSFELEPELEPELSRNVISPTANSVISGACPGRTPRYPFFPGIWISSATVSTTFFSGVTISSLKVSLMNQLSAVSYQLSAQCRLGPLRVKLKADG